ncbi:hypothetical protein Q8F55_000058 [Vanrija albida]|uniref:Uncharacterized protein n=1 Tax=Vanrija albida TaxID=181172 RepID=A0ABR3QC67_9TREE
MYQALGDAMSTWSGQGTLSITIVGMESLAPANRVTNIDDPVDEFIRREALIVEDNRSDWTWHSRSVRTFCESIRLIAQALLAVRGTSKHFKRHVDAPFAHVVMRGRPRTHRHGHWHVHDHFATVTSYVCLTTATSPARPLPWFPFAIEVLDHICAQGFSYSSPTFRGFDKARLANLHTVRRFDHAPFRTSLPVPSSTTVVDFLDLTLLPPVLGFLATPQGTGRSVLHLKYDPSAYDQIDMEVRVLPPEVEQREVVFVLWPAEPKEDDTPPAPGPLHFLYSAIMSTLEGWCGPDISVGSVTIVGMECADEKHRVQSPVALWDDIFDHGLDKVQAYWPRDEAIVADMSRATRFLTREEWWDEIGERKAIEGLWL